MQYPGGKGRQPNQRRDLGKESRSPRRHSENVVSPRRDIIADAVTPRRGSHELPTPREGRGESSYYDDDFTGSFNEAYSNAMGTGWAGWNLGSEHEGIIIPQTHTAIITL